MKLQNSAVSSFSFNGNDFYVKRDDLLDPQFNGNKARKLASFLANPAPEIQTLISYGGYQSNMMYALSGLARLNNWQFIYYTRRQAKSAEDKEGNLAASLANGMQLIEVKDNFKQFCQQLSEKPGQLLIKQGGAQSEAELGFKQLAVEIKLWAKEMKFSELAVFIASGTGTSAVYLQKYLAPFKVYTTNCVGTQEYLLKQFQALASPEQNLPIILNNTKFRFATPQPLLKELIEEINLSSNIEFDLVYDPVGWYILLENIAAIKAPLLYIHCGGRLGNSSMLKRYAQLE